MPTSHPQKFTQGLIAQLQAAGIAATLAPDGDIDCPSTAGTFRVRPDRFYARFAAGTPLERLVAEVAGHLHAVEALHTQETTDPAALRAALGVRLTAQDPASLVTRTRLGPLCEALVLDLPTQYAFLSATSLERLGLSVADAWALADQQAAARGREPDAIRDLPQGAKALCWAGADAADQAWQAVRGADQATLAVPSAECAMAVVGTHELEVVGPLGVFATTYAFDPGEHALTPQLLLLEQGRLVEAALALPLTFMPSRSDSVVH